MKIDSYPEFGDIRKLSPSYIQKIRRELRSRLRKLVQDTVHQAGNIADKVEVLKRDIRRLSDANVSANRK